MRVLIVALLASLTVPAWAQNLDNLGALTQGQFRQVSEDLAGALSYRPQSPTEPLGLFGFDIGVGATGAKLKNAGTMALASSNGAPSTMVIPTVQARLGLPFRFDIGAAYSQVPDSNITTYGGELAFAFIEGSTTMPAIGIRGSMTTVSGISQLDLDTRALDVSISKGIAFMTPYGGLGRVWATSTPKGVALSKEEVALNKYYVGVGFKILLLNLNLEADKTGEVLAYSAKLGLRF